MHGAVIVAWSNTDDAELKNHAKFIQHGVYMNTLNIESDAVDQKSLAGMPRIFTILLNWNGKTDTLACLESLQKTEYLAHTVVVVDNGSTDGSQEVIASQFPGAIIIQNKENLGFAGGNNVGIEYAMAHGADYLFILNNDTEVDKNIFGEFIKVAEQGPAAAVLGAKIYYFKPSDRIWYAGAEWSWERAEFGHVGCDQTDNGRDWEKIRPVDYVCGCAMFIKAEVFRKIGLFDARFFILWEESDWCYRALKAGYPSLFVPTAKVWHKVSSTFGNDTRSPRYLYFWWRNRLLFIKRHIPFQRRLSLYRRVIIMEILRSIKGYVNPRANPVYRKKCRAVLRGVWDYEIGRLGDCPSWLKR